MASLNGSPSFRLLPSLGHSTSKAGIIIGMTSQLAVEGREYGIRAKSISPGLIETNQTRYRLKDPEWAVSVLGKTLLGRLGRSEEVANVAARGACHRARGVVVANVCRKSPLAEKSRRLGSRLLQADDSVACHVGMPKSSVNSTR
jgi:NAD(P)-dependent dehydrogenase (short-subunit alcohol dehydrogenase family)